MNQCPECKKPKYVKCCHNCKKDGEKCEVYHACGDDCPGWEEMTKTNADRIRAMSDEELAEFLYRFEYGTEELGAPWDCQGEALQWLRETADQDDDEDDDEDERLPRIGRWLFWDGWVSNHDLRIVDALCSSCAYQHPTVRWEEGDPTGEEARAVVLGKLAKECPRCGAKMIGGGDGEE